MPNSILLLVFALNILKLLYYLTLFEMKKISIYFFFCGKEIEDYNCVDFTLPVAEDLIR